MYLLIIYFETNYIIYLFIFELIKWSQPAYTPLGCLDLSGMFHSLEHQL